jgi:membrane-bound lytic murein transglycosylase B
MGSQAKDYTVKKEVKQFINKMVTKHHFQKGYLNTLFKNIVFQKSALGIFNPKYRTKNKKKHYPKNAHLHGSWTRYQKNIFTKAKIALGVKYMRKHQKIFKKSYKKYGVPPEYVAAIIGVESRYGVKLGEYLILDTLTTLAFEKNRRSHYFLSELEKFLLLSKSEKFNPRQIKGSYAGAIGLGQFMPSSYKAFAVDFNKDGKKDMHNSADAIASIANYLHKNGWRQWEPVAERVNFKGDRYHGKKTGYNTLYPQSTLKELKIVYGKWSYKGSVRLIKLDRYRYDELWFGAENFYVITRYNHSAYYAMAVHQLAQQLKREYKRKHGAILR